MFYIENDNLRIAIQEKGAELTSIFHKQYQIEYLWNAEPAVWAKHSPVLFPIVGTLKADTYFFKGKGYQLPRHGFARDKNFHVTSHSPTELMLLLKSDQQTLKVYPFEFAFTINYSLFQDRLQVTYEVISTANEEMYFSVGGHPAFKVPLIEGTAYEDYYLQFNEVEDTPRWPISSEGLIKEDALPFFDSSDTIQLSKQLFQNDALVFKSLMSNIVSLKSEKTRHGFDFNFSGFPYLGLWAAKNADFVCIEPWCGIADSVLSDQQLENKEGVQYLPAGTEFRRTWEVKFY